MTKSKLRVKQNPQVLVQTVTNNKNETFEILLRKQDLTSNAARQITVFQNLWLEPLKFHMTF